ncbi:MAG: hypothetical protein ACOYNL_09100 [Rickettsiales bacterium]
MPITAPIVALALVLGLAMPGVAQATNKIQTGRIFVEHAYQLENHEKVLRLGQMYRAFAGTYVLFDGCAAELKVKPDLKNYVLTKFPDIAKDYQRSYIDAYAEYIGNPPKQAFIDDVTKTIADQQQKTVNNMATLIRNEGCDTQTAASLIRYTDTLFKADTAPPVDPALSAPKVQFTKKNKKPTPDF